MPFRDILLLPAACMALCLWASTARAAGAEKPEKPKDAGALIERIPLAKLDPEIVLQSGDIKISVARVLKVETAYVAATKRKFPRASINPSQYSRLRRRFAFQFLVNAVIEKYAADHTLSVPPEIVESNFEKLKKLKAASGTSYEQHLADNGLSDEEYRRFWTAKWAMERQIAEKELKDEDVAKRMLEMSQPENLPLRRVSHILFTYHGSQSAEPGVLRSQEDAKTSALAAIAKLKGGEDFDKLARESSDCPSGERGGDLDFVPRKNVMVEALGEAVYKLEKIGDISKEPLETPIGFHVLKLTGMKTVDAARAEVQKEFPSQRVRDILIRERFDKLMQQLVEQAAAAAQFNEKLVPDAPPEPKRP